MTKDIEIRRLFSSPDEYAGQDVVIRGWVRQNRSSNKFGFLAVNDGSFFSPVQVVYEADTLENYKDIAALNLSSAVMVRGEFVLTPENKHQAFEIHAREIVVEGPSAPDYPLQKKGHSMEFLREIAHLRPRSNTFAAVFRVRSLLAYAIHRFFQERGFIYVHTPIITGSDAEGAGEMFRVTTINPADPPRTEDGAVDYTQDFFGRPTNLTVSGQLEGEIFAHAFRNIYTFGPTFRAEDSNTTRHASEFWMIEPEMAFCDLDGNMQVAEDMIRYILSDILETAPEELEFFNKYVDKGLLDRLAHVASSNFERVSYTKAIELLEKADRKFENPVSWGIDLATEHERYLTEEVFKRPIFVTDYPADIKAFYMRRNPDGKTVAACDMLVPGIGEIIGGSQREERLDVLEKRMDELGMDKTPYWWYLELRKYGGVVHSGYGLGFERMVMYATGMGNIRDVIPFPRTPKSAEF